MFQQGNPIIGRPDYVPNEGTWLDVGVPFQGIKRKGIEEGETSYGGTYEDVINKRNEIASNPEYPLYSSLPPAAAAPGADQATGHAVVTQAEQNYADVLGNPNIDPLTKAALNPNFNAELPDSRYPTPTVLFL